MRSKDPVKFLPLWIVIFSEPFFEEYILLPANPWCHFCHMSGFSVRVAIILGSLCYLTSVPLIFLHAITIILSLQLYKYCSLLGQMLPTLLSPHNNFLDHLKYSRPRAATFLYILEFLQFLTSLLVSCLQSSFRNQQQLWKLLKNEQEGLCTFWKNKQRQRVRIRVRERNYEKFFQ